MDHPNVILLLDSNSASRENLTKTLQSHLPGIVLLATDRIHPISPPPNLVVFRAHGKSADGCVNLIRATFGMTLSILLMSDSEDEKEIIEAVHTHKLRGYISAGLHPSLIASTLMIASAPPLVTRKRERDNKSDGLTSRETDVLSLLRKGMQNKIIAFQLEISEYTVKHHIRSIMRKMGASNRTQLAVTQLVAEHAVGQVVADRPINSHPIAHVAKAPASHLAGNWSVGTP